ncbi:hypothetical protein B0H14DRAFT_784560 [Mycena olivaceomarginata]|nr:hypothetical protein B0H14DRAFT_784560 [Mycena olivaceomarginata]
MDVQVFLRMTHPMIRFLGVLLLVLCATSLAAGATVRETNGQRMARGLPPASAALDAADSDPDPRKTTLSFSISEPLKRRRVLSRRKCPAMLHRRRPCDRPNRGVSSQTPGRYAQLRSGSGRNNLLSLEQSRMYPPGRVLRAGRFRWSDSDGVYSCVAGLKLQFQFGPFLEDLSSCLSGSEPLAWQNRASAHWTTILLTSLDDILLPVDTDTQLRGRRTRDMSADRLSAPSIIFLVVKILVRV